MAVPEQTPYKEYIGNGVTKIFPLEFDCNDKDHLVVFIDENEPVVGDWQLDGGVVIFKSAPKNGAVVKVQRNTPFRRDRDYQSYDNSFRPPVVNKDFDWIWWKLQELGVADWILGNRINSLKNYVDHKDDELKAYLLEEIRKQGVALDQLDDYYNYLMSRLDQIAIDKGWDASFVVDGDENQKQINNTTIRVVQSISSLADIQNPKDGQVVFVKSYNSDQAQGGDNYEFLNGKWNRLNSDIVTVLNYGAQSNKSAADVFDSTSAFQEALDFEWVVYPAATSLAYYPKSKNKRVRVPLGRYLITDTLPLTSYLHMDFDDGVVIEFKPVTKKSLFDLPIQKMKDAYNGGATTWKDMTLYGVRFTGAATLKGNMTGNSTVHADYAIHASNSHRGFFSRFAIEGFENGLFLDRLDTSSWTGGNAIGNFYENVVDNVSIQDCKNCFYNEANLTTVINGRMGHETIGKTDPNMGDYIVVNKGAGFTSLNLNIASIDRYNNPKIGHIFEQCKGSTYHGIYSEYFDNLFVVDPITRGGGLNIDTSYIVKYPPDFLIKYVEGYMPSYNPATGLRGGRNLKGANAWVELFNGGIQIMNSNPSLLEDFFEFAPQYDFKYGMYGVGIPWAQNIATDFKRWETKETGFLSSNGVRFIATQSTSLYFQVKQNQYDAYVCVLIRDLIGNYDSSNVKLNVVVGSNQFITVAENIYDYGNGWKMIAVRNVQTDPAAKTDLIVEIPTGCQIEIEHIGAYLNGVPLYPNFRDCKPKVNSDSYCYSSLNDSAGGGYAYKYSGGQFGLGDELSPFIPKLPDGSIVTTEVIANQYISQEGSNRATLKDGNHAAYYGDANITFSDAFTFDSDVVAAGNGRNFAESVGIGLFIGVTQATVLIDNTQVVERVYDVASKKYTTKLKLDKEFSMGAAVANLWLAIKPVFNQIGYIPPSP